MATTWPKLTLSRGEYFPTATPSREREMRELERQVMGLVERGRRQTREKTHPARLKAAAASSDTFLTEGADSPRASSQRRAARDGRQAERERQQAERRARLRAPASSRSAPTFNHRER